MPQNPINSHKQDKMSEESEYILQEVKPVVNVMSKKIEESLNLKDIKPLIEKVETLVSTKDFMYLVDDYNERVVNCPTNDEIVDSITILSQKVDGLKDAMISLTQKMDSEDVTNLDTDYESTIDANSI